jgi:hypothetical protein
MTVSEMPKFPWDTPMSDRLLYETIARMAPEDRTPIEASLKRYIDMLLESIEGLDALRTRAQAAETNHERLTQRVQELEKALKSAASTAHYRGVLRGASDVCHGSFDECTNCARWKTILAGTEKEAAK